MIYAFVDASLWITKIHPRNATPIKSDRPTTFIKTYIKKKGETCLQESTKAGF